MFSTLSRLHLTVFGLFLMLWVANPMVPLLNKNQTFKKKKNPQKAHGHFFICSTEKCNWPFFARTAFYSEYFFTLSRQQEKQYKIICWK